MPKFMVTLHLTQYVIVEAENEREAVTIADNEACDDDWSNQNVVFPLNVEPYHGEREPFNLSEIEAAIFHLGQKS